MKFNRSYLFIAVSSIALLIVLIIQVNWIFRTARIREELFNEKANMVLARTTDALLSDDRACANIGDCIDNDSSKTPTAKLGRDEVQKIDSLFNYYMKFYNFHIGYSYEVVKPQTAPVILSNWKNAAQPGEQACYEKGLDAIAQKKGLELKLIFPGKKQFIIAEMTGMFITSVLLIIVVLVLFWRTIRSLMREKQISEHTTDFLNNMTHEFKTPLTNIALAGRMISKDPRQEEKIKHYSGIILEENEKLRLQVEQVLSMTALERGEIPLQKAELDAHQLIRDALKCISIQVENKQGGIQTEFDAEKFIIMGDQTHLTNALCNLVDNALKYSGDKPHLFIRTYNTPEQLVIIVADNGIGIEKEYHKKVFDKFFRVPTGDVHNVKGFGLGLAYVKKIVELHGGRIELESEKGKGTVFTITLPYV